MSLINAAPTLSSVALVAAALVLGTGPAAFAESGDKSPASYASLPSDPSTTGSLPTGTTPTVRTLTSFAAAVEHGSIQLRASTPTSCLPGNLKDVVADLSARFGTVSVQSTHRTRGHNWRAGGARQSLHLACRAVDFRIRTRTRGVMAYLRSRPEVGGLKVYRNGIIHIDNGERRSW